MAIVNENYYEYEMTAIWVKWEMSLLRLGYDKASERKTHTLKNFI